MYYATYGFDKLRSIKGSRRIVINRLKRASWYNFVDSLQISLNGELLCEPGEWSKVFSKEELAEIRYAHGWDVQTNGNAHTA